MDINLSYKVSNEDLVGVLRTIWLFLENLNFNVTSSVLQDECSSKGYPSVTSGAAKVLVVTPSSIDKKSISAHYNTQQSHKANQTEATEEDDEPYDLAGSIGDESFQENRKIVEPVYIYYTDVANFSNRIFSETVIETHPRPKIENLDKLSCQCNDSIRNKRDSFKKIIHEPVEYQNMSPNKGKKLSKRSPNTIESEIPSKKLERKPSKENLKQIRKSHSNPSLKLEPEESSSKINKNDLQTVSNNPVKSITTAENDLDDIDSKELKKKFRQLQKEHQKLMSVTTELTTALQTHIMGQSENLNAMLNNCRNIYPDLFTTGNHEALDDLQKINYSEEETSKQNSAMHISNSIETTSETVSFKIISTHNINHNSAKMSSEILAGDLFNSESNTNIQLNSNRSPKRNSLETAKKGAFKIISSQEIRQDSSKPVTSPKRATDDLDEKTCKDISGRMIPPNEFADVLVIEPSDLLNQNSFTNPLDEASTSKNISIKDISKDQTLSDLISRDKSSSQESQEALQEIERVSGRTIVHPTKLKRTRSSSIVLVPANDNKVLLRQLSSKSCDDSLLGNLSTQAKSSSVSFKSDNEKSNQENRNDKELPKDDTEKSHLNNKFQLHYATYNETPEIYVTTENLSKLKRSSRCPSTGTSESNFSSPRNQYFDLDFRKLKRDLLCGDDNLKLALVQALRWRMTQSDNETRDQIISSYIRHDLLGLHSAPNACGQSTMELYYTPSKESPHPLQEGMARLVNTFASLTLGRDYLCQDDDLLVSLLVPLLIGTHYSKVKISDITRDMLMATLQKLSLRNRQRLRMISAGLMEYLVKFLINKHSTVSAYCMEYTTALFMNLCLHPEARERLRTDAADVLRLLADLLSTRHQCCMPYVNGALYSLLGDSYFNEEAQRLNIGKLIEYHIKRTDGEVRRQLKFILKLHLSGPGESDCGCDPNIEPENEVDLLEPELDTSDSYNKQPSGEKLLKDYKMLFSVYGSQVYAAHLKCLCRPVTPIPQFLKQSRNPDVDKISQEDDNTDDILPKCTCEKSTQFEDVKPCTCRASSSSREHIDNAQVSAVHAKRGLSEPSTFKNNSEKLKKETESEQSSRLISPDLSFCEETQQLYYKPSAKTGIFEPKKGKKLHRVPPSFTRTIAMPIQTENPPPTCSNPHCPYPYTKVMPIHPKENSSIRNPPFAVEYSDGFTTCYRQTFNRKWKNCVVNNAAECDCYNCRNVCPNCKKRNRYACNCYNIIKKFIDDTPQRDLRDNSRDDNNIDGKTCRCGTNPHQTLCHSCQHSQNVTPGEPTVKNKSSSVPTRIVSSNSNINNAIVNFSYQELQSTVDTDGHDQTCSNPDGEDRCYDEVFQSRPKILRTPP